jgi:predicted metal-dependent HD superfamily phosphohydrolase
MNVTADMLRGKIALALGEAAGLSPLDERVNERAELLVSCWAQPHRHYHSLAHLAQCLEALDQYRDLAVDPLAVELALIFHDAVYWVDRPGSEHASAQLAHAVLSALQIDLELDERVAGLVKDTDHLRAATGDSALVQDLDLLVLAAHKRQFDAYEDAVRREYAFVPDEVFRPARVQILQALLERPSIYQTAQIRTEHEERARENLERSIMQLS